MTLLTVIRDVCAVVGVTIPPSVFPGIAGNRTMMEMVSLANEMAQRIAYDTREWTRLKATRTFTGDDVTIAWDMPEDFKRLLLNSEVWRSTSSQQPMHFVPDANEWMKRRNNEDHNSWGEWTIIGGQMHIHPPLAGPTVATVDAPAYPATTASFVYLDKNCIKLASGGVASEFQGDGDTYLLDERLLKLGMIWQWKAQKGQPYGEDMGTWTDALGMAMGTDSPSPIIVDRRPMRHRYMTHGHI